MFLVKTISAIIIFGLIILIHEFGHFILAKACGVKVIEFSLGMGPRLFTYHGKDTDYSLKVFPLGGSCQMKGEDEEKGSEDEDSFQNKKPWQRFLIVFAGPAFNFILAFIIGCILVLNVGSDRPLVSDTSEGLPAAICGILPGDEIVNINGRNIRLYREISLYNYIHAREAQEVTVKRNNGYHTYSLTPVYSEEYGRYLIGITGPGEYTKPSDIFETFRFGYYEMRYNFLAAVDSIIYLINGHFSKDSVMGPVGIIGTISDTVEEAVPNGLRIVLLTLADFILLFSTNVGVMNLLPFPALDGGRIVMIVFEWITGKTVNRKVENYINFIGFALLMLLMLLITVNDIGRMI